MAKKEVQPVQGEESAPEVVVPPKVYGEQWRGRIAGSTYRIFTVAPVSFYPEKIVLQRLCSVANQPEEWLDEWGQK